MRVNSPKTGYDLRLKKGQRRNDDKTYGAGEHEGDPTGSEHDDAKSMVLMTATMAKKIMMASRTATATMVPTVVAASEDMLFTVALVVVVVAVAAASTITMVLVLQAVAAHAILPNPV